MAGHHGDVFSLAPPRSMVWTGTLAAAALAWLAGYLSGLTLTPDSRGLALAFGLSALLCLLWVPNASGRIAQLVRMIEALLLFALIGVLGAVLSYLAMLHSSGFADALLHRMDHALGFDWPAMRSYVERRDWLFLAFEKGYLACFWMPLAVFGLLWHAQRIGDVYRYLLAHGLALAATVGVFFFFPARATFAFYLAPGAPLPGNARHYGEIIAGLRDGTLTTLDLTNLGGIITFPSFHAAMAILFVWGAWPARHFRAPMLVVNGLMWLAAVPLGGHYVVDVIAGSAIAAGAIVLAVRLARGAAAAPAAASVPAAPGPVAVGAA
ncbi:phosphatase PAP2 family protein [Sphingomonas sp. DG1-23]|uniref:phosphatase PAP2 family protein n=1 Tax=Sphingomonas sp. DG1-23 TaxID=3068316 RepID=UPI00273E33AB|nr:phosphatase PAP2 family protein [Sphingomonas sp. DG1-23]MDP5277606.1 phosphatase PAP2 family protein [Sphingomonas sp. DG1-23]